MIMIDTLGGLCSICRNRFKRVFIPEDITDFIDISDMESDIKQGDIVVFNICLMTGMHLRDDVTYECTHFESNEEANSNIFKHFNNE